jgi:hypothetical protein
MLSNMTLQIEHELSKWSAKTGLTAVRPIGNIVESGQSSLGAMVDEMLYHPGLLLREIQDLHKLVAKGNGITAALAAVDADIAAVEAEKFAALQNINLVGADITVKLAAFAERLGALKARRDAIEKGSGEYGRAVQRVEAAARLALDQLAVNVRAAINAKHAQMKADIEAKIRAALGDDLLDRHAEIAWMVENCRSATPFMLTVSRVLAGEPAPADAEAGG